MIGILQELALIPNIEKYIGFIGAFIGSIVVYFIHLFLKNKWEREDTRFDANGRDEINNIGKL